MADRPVFVYAAVYDSINDAEADYVGDAEAEEFRRQLMEAAKHEEDAP